MLSSVVAPTQPDTSTSASTPSTATTAAASTTTAAQEPPPKPFPIFNRSPGSGSLPHSPVLLKKGVTAKTAVTARKTAGTISSPPLPTAEAPSPFAAPIESSSARRPTRRPGNRRLPSDDNTSSSSLGSPRLRAAHAARAQAALKLRKRKRKGDDDDDMVMSDLPLDSTTTYTKSKTNLSNAAGSDSASKTNATTDTTPLITPVPEPPSSDVTEVNPSPATAQSPTFTGSKAPSPPSAAPETVAPTPNGSATTATAQPVSDRPKSSSNLSSNLAKQRLAAAERRANSLKSIPHEVITIDSDDDDVAPPPTIIPATTASANGVKLALVERAGKAAVVSVEEAKAQSPVSYPPTSFTQRVKAITDQLKAAPKHTAEERNKSREEEASARDNRRSESTNDDTISSSRSNSQAHSSNNDSSVHSASPSQSSFLATTKGNSKKGGPQLATPPGEDSLEGIAGDSSGSISGRSNSGVGALDTPEAANQAELNSRMLASIREKWIQKYNAYEDGYARELRTEAVKRKDDKFYVGHDFFQNISDADTIPPEVLEEMVTRLEYTIFTLYEEASQYIIANQFYQLVPGVLIRGRIDEYFVEHRKNKTLVERLHLLLREFTVMAVQGNCKVTFQAWKDGGRKPLMGKIVLCTEAILELVETHKRVSSEIDAEAILAGACKGYDGNDEDEDDQMRDDFTVVGGSSPPPPPSRHADKNDRQGQGESNGLQQPTEPATVQPPQSQPPQPSATQPPLSPPHSPGQNGQLGVQPANQDVEMRDAEPLGAEVVQPAREGRRSSLIVKLAAPSTVLRKFNEHAASAPAITDEFFKASPSVAPVPKYTGSARSQIKKSAGNPPRYSDIIREMHHFGESRMEQIVATSREKYDDYLIRIRELDAQKEKIRRELMRISEEGTAKSRQFDEKLSHMLFEADVLDNRARRGRAGMSSFNAFLPPDRDLSWSKYQELVQEKADHETDVAAAREKLVRRGMSINEEKIRIVRMQEESAKWDKKLNDMREAKKLELLVLEQPLGIVADVVANTGITSSAPSQTAAPPESEAPSPRAQSAAIPGTGPNEESEPPLPAPATVQSSATETPGPSSSIFSSSIDLETSSSTPPQAQPGAEADTEAESTDNTSTPQPQLLPHGGRKVNPQDLGRALIDTSGGYAAILLASIRNAALLPDSDEGPPSSSIKMPPLTQSSWYGVGGGAYSAPTTTTEAAASLQRKKKKVRARKGW